jgi:hypothetical protein
MSLARSCCGNDVLAIGSAFTSTTTEAVAVYVRGMTRVTKAVSNITHRNTNSANFQRARKIR